MSRRILVGVIAVAFATCTSDALAYQPPCHRVRAELQTLEMAIELHAIMKGSLPDEAHWIEQLIKSEEISVHVSGIDPWGSPYVYRLMGSSFELFSLGPDGLAGTYDDQTRAEGWTWHGCRSPRAGFGCMANR